MLISKMEEVRLPAAEDFHVHLRQGDMRDMVGPMVAQGGVCRALVMPNTVPPLTRVEQALTYKEELEKIAPGVDFLATLFLHPSLTPAVVEEAARCGVNDVKSYPRGTTTNSEGGVEDYSIYSDVFATMERLGMILHLHGEVPSNHDQGVCALNAEDKFLIQLEKLHSSYPSLRIILEHVTTRKAVDLVLSLPDTVAGSITAHHLFMCVDDWIGQPHNFCKPVAKYPDDRSALQAVAVEGHRKFFLGSDSAPHPRAAKECEKASAGVFTSPLLMAYVVTVLKRLGADWDAVERFTSANGRAFYGVPDLGKTVIVTKQPQPVPISYPFEGGEVVPFMAGQSLDYTVKPDW